METWRATVHASPGEITNSGKEILDIIKGNTDAFVEIDLN